MPFQGFFGFKSDFFLSKIRCITSYDKIPVSALDIIFNETNKDQLFYLAFSLELGILVKSVEKVKCVILLQDERDLD